MRGSYGYCNGQISSRARVRGLVLRSPFLRMICVRVAHGPRGGRRVIRAGCGAAGSSRSWALTTRVADDQAGVRFLGCPANVGARADGIFGNATVHSYQHEPVFI